jgi:hypothetical protein
MIAGMLYEAVVACLRHCWITIASLRQEFELGTSKFGIFVGAVFTSVILETRFAAFYINILLGSYFAVGLRTTEILLRKCVTSQLLVIHLLKAANAEESGLLVLLRTV